MLPFTVSTLALSAGELGANVTVFAAKLIATEEESALRVIWPVIGAAWAPVTRKKVARAATADVILSFIVVILWCGWMVNPYLELIPCRT